ncbi:MAG: hypothetical protein ABII80_01305 [bacterium]
MIEIGSDGNEVHGREVLTNGVRSALQPFFVVDEGGSGISNIWEIQDIWEDDTPIIGLREIQSTRARVTNLLVDAVDFDVQPDEILGLIRTLYYLRRLADPNTYNASLL